MGCIQSKEFQILIRSKEFQSWNIDFKKIYINDYYLQKLYTIFLKIDLDNSGKIGFIELLTLLDVENTKFTERVFSIFDNDNSGEIDFYEFVITIWNYCTLSKTTLERFAFDLYDKDCSDELSINEVIAMVKDIFGETAIKTNIYAKTIIQDLIIIQTKHTKNSHPNNKEEHLLNFNFFREFIRTHQMMLFPIHQIQYILQKKILGKRFWKHNSSQRYQHMPGFGYSVPIGKINEYIKTIPTIVDNDVNGVRIYYNENTKQSVLYPVPNYQVQDLMRIIGTRAHRKKLADATTIVSHATNDNDIIIPKLKKIKPKGLARRRHSGPLMIFQKGKSQTSQPQTITTTTSSSSSENINNHLPIAKTNVGLFIKSTPQNLIKHTNAKSLDMESFLVITKSLSKNHNPQNKIIPTNYMIETKHQSDDSYYPNNNITTNINLSLYTTTPQKTSLHDTYYDTSLEETKSINTSIISDEDEDNNNEFLSSLENLKRIKTNKLKLVIRDDVYIKNSNLLMDNLSTIKSKSVIEDWKSQTYNQDTSLNAANVHSNTQNKVANYFKNIKTHQGLFQKSKNIGLHYLYKQ